MNRIIFLFVLITCFIITTIFFVPFAFMENADAFATKLIDFGTDERGNTFGLAGWKTPIRDKYTNNKTVS